MEFTHWPAGLTFLAHIYAMIPEVFRVVFLSFLFFLRLYTKHNNNSEFDAD